MAHELEEIVGRSPGAPGLALIFSCDYKSIPTYPELVGAEKDGQSMERSLRSLGYATKRMHNFSRGDLFAVLYHVSENLDYPRSYKRVVFVFSGHGKDGELISSEGKANSVNEVVKKLSPTSSSSPLKNMVRLFFIDACRGDAEDTGRIVSKGGTEGDWIRIPCERSNFLLAYSTVSGSRSYEERDCGGLWMTLLAEKLTECDDNIQGVLTCVNQELLEKMQDKSKYPCMQQPESLIRLNEQVNLFREKPIQQEASPKGPRLTGQAVVSVASPTSSLRTRPPDVALSRSDCSGTTDHSGETPTRKRCISLAANFSGSPSQKVGLQRCTSQPSLDHKISALPTLCRQPTFPLTSQSPGLVARESEIVKVHSPSSSGTYRSKLNTYQQHHHIRYTWQDEEKISPTGARLGFTSCVEAILKDGERIVCGSQDIYLTKGASREAAAANVIEVLDGKLRSSPVHQSIRTSPKSLEYKGKLNNMMQGTFHTQLPNYDTRQVDEQKFQCTVKHFIFGRITGCVCNSKKEAENVAAYRAYISCHK